MPPNASWRWLDVVNAVSPDLTQSYIASLVSNVRLPPTGHNAHDYSLETLGPWLSRWMTMRDVEAGQLVWDACLDRVSARLADGNVTAARALAMLELPTPADRLRAFRDRAIAMCEGGADEPVSVTEELARSPADEPTVAETTMVTPEPTAEI